MGLYYSVALSQQTHVGIDSLIKETLYKHQIPALVVGLVKPDTCLFGIGGVNKIGGKQKVTLEHKFHLGSNTKAITSFVAFQMIEKNQIALSDKFFDLFPEWRTFSNKAYLDITLQQLLSHQAGIQPYTNGTEYKKLPILKGSVSDKRTNFAKFVLQEKAVKKGTYSNAGYALAALMLGKKSGVPFEALLAKTFKQLSLEYFLGFPNKEQQSNPWGHWKEGKQLIALKPTHFYQLEDYMMSAGDVAMNIKDYATFIQLHLNGLIGKNNVLKSTSYKKMHFGIPNYSFGWGNMILKKEQLSYHDGSAGTYYCHVIMFPDKQLAVIIMANTAQQAQVRAIYKLRKTILKKYHQN